MGDSGDLRILLRNTFLCIDHQYHHLGTLYGTDGTDDHITLQFFLDLVLPAKTGSINEDIFFAVISDLGIHRISGGTRDIRNDQTVLTQQFVDQGRLADIGLSDDGHTGAVILFFLCLFLIKIFRYGLQHVTDSQTIHRRDRMGIANTQIVEFVDIRHILLEAVHLIDHQYHGLVGTAQHVCHLGIRIHQSLLYIHQENDHVCSLHSDLCLFPHLGQDHVLAVRLDTSCVDQGKCHIQPVDIRIDTVSGNTGCIFHNRYIFASQCIEQGGLTDIRASHHRNDGLGFSLCHNFLRFLFTILKSIQMYLLQAGHPQDHIRLILQYSRALVKPPPRLPAYNHPGTDPLRF